MSHHRNASQTGLPDSREDAGNRKGSQRSRKKDESEGQLNFLTMDSRGRRGTNDSVKRSSIKRSTSSGSQKVRLGLTSEKLLTTLFNILKNRTHIKPSNLGFELFAAESELVKLDQLFVLLYVNCVFTVLFWVGVSRCSY